MCGADIPDLDESGERDNKRPNKKENIGIDDSNDPKSLSDHQGSYRGL
jgi:hypothetical protein